MGLKRSENQTGNSREFLTRGENVVYGNFMSLFGRCFRSEVSRLASNGLQMTIFTTFNEKTFSFDPVDP